jgi:nucleoside-diphosphate-sugar epimerase
MKKSVLVVGGAGYVGSHTAKQLTMNGFTPVVLDRDIKTKPWATQYGPAFECNLPRDIDFLKEIVNRYNIDSCIHFAACTRISESVKDPSKYYKNNVVMTIQLLDKLREVGVNKFVFSSSAAVYGAIEDGMAKDDELNLQPINPYGMSKLMVENILKDYYVAYGLSSISLRYFNAAGADADSEVGELRQDEFHIIPLAIEAAFHSKEFQLFGTDFDTPDGTCVRDYVHVTDLAVAHVLALQKVSGDVVCGRYNLGSGIGISNQQLLDTIKKYLGEFKIVKTSKRAGDPPVLIANNDRAKKELGWKLEHSTIDNIVCTAVKWYNNINKKDLN